MGFSSHIVCVLIAISFAFARPNQKSTSTRNVFSLKTERARSLRHDATSTLDPRTLDAPSYHVDPSHNFAWTPVYLGPQRLGVMLDVGSTQFWVFASQNSTVQPSNLLSYTQLYEPGASPSWQSIPNASFASSYQAGFTATGIVGTDSLTVGDLPSVRQHVGVMWYDKPVMDPQQIQGILGLGLPSDGTSGTMGMPSFLNLLIPELELPLFAQAISKDGTGTWDFGHVNDTKHTNPFQTILVDDTCNAGGSWKMANISAQFPEGTIAQASCGMFDTGWDLINLDAAIVARYYQDVPGANFDTAQGQYTFPCNATLPDLTITINGAGVTIRGHVLNYHPYDAEANTCMGALQSAGDGGNALFGQTFYMAQYVIFHVGGRTISFAEIAQDI